MCLGRELVKLHPLGDEFIVAAAVCDATLRDNQDPVSACHGQQSSSNQSSLLLMKFVFDNTPQHPRSQLYNAQRHMFRVLLFDIHDGNTHTQASSSQLRTRCGRCVPGRNWSWWVTSTRVVAPKNPRMQRSNMCWPTCASTAESGSSSRFTSAPVAECVI